MNIGKIENLSSRVFNGDLKVLNNYNIKGEGNSRIVIECDGKIIKFAKYNVQQNKHEVKNWEKSKNENINHLFAPVIDYDSENYKWLVMEKLETKREISVKQFKKVIDELLNKNFIIRDISINDFGYLENNIRIFDYGVKLEDIDNISRSKKEIKKEIENKKYIL